MRTAFCAMLLGLTVVPCFRAFAQDPGQPQPGQKTPADPVGEVAAGAEKQSAEKQEELFRKLEERLNGVKFVGRFTVTGRENGGNPEEYVIRSAKKLPQGDKWQLNARIKYGQFDLTVPLVLDIKWAGTTPVITLDDFTIPALGTFSARVVIDEDKYAGTWSHKGAAGGHMFGTLEKLNETEESSSED